MKIELWTIGKSNDALYDKAIAEFTKRLAHYCDFHMKIIASKANVNASVEKQKQMEGEQILALLDKSDLLIALDEYGKPVTTVQFAEKLQQYMNQSAKKLVFLIGGAYGIDEAVLKMASFKLSLSQLTFPHQLVRLIFTEQLYRAFTVLNNEKYHHV